MTAAQEIKYTYDALDRLIGVDYSSGKRLLFTYDAAGNRTSIVVTDNSEGSPSTDTDIGPEPNAGLPSAPETLTPTTPPEKLS